MLVVATTFPPARWICVSAAAMPVSPIVPVVWLALLVSSSSEKETSTACVLPVRFASAAAAFRVSTFESKDWAAWVVTTTCLRPLATLDCCLARTKTPPPASTTSRSRPARILRIIERFPSDALRDDRMLGRHPLDEAVTNGIDRCLRPVRNAELLEDRRDVTLHRFR